MKSDKIVKAFNTVQPNDEIKNRVFDSAVQKQHKKRPVFKAAVSFAAVAAVICLMVFGSMVLTPQDDNVFVIKAYAMEVQDGSVQLCAVDIVDTRPEYWGFYIDGETKTMYVSLGLRCEGENIRNVEFSTSNGSFSKQYIGNLSSIPTSGVPAVYVGPEHRLAVFGTDFDNVGSTISLDKEKANDYLLFWGTNYVTDPENPQLPHPKEISVHAKVTFTTGKTAQKDITIDLSGTGMGAYNPSEAQKAQNQKDYEAYKNLLHSIPLDKCEVVPDSVKTLTYGDTYAFNTSTTSTGYTQITKDSMDAAPFDENGIFEQASNLPTDGSDGYIAVIKRNEDVTFTGMVYKVPGQLILDHMK